MYRHRTVYGTTNDKEFNKIMHCIKNLKTLRFLFSSTSLNISIVDPRGVADETAKINS